MYYHLHINSYCIVDWYGAEAMIKLGVGVHMIGRSLKKKTPPKKFCINKYKVKIRLSINTVEPPLVVRHHNNR